jgi:hypothetical protein
LNKKYICDKISKNVVGCDYLNRFKKFLSLTLSIFIFVSSFLMIDVYASDTGSLGVNETNITWSFDEVTGVLTVKGYGKMKSLNNPNGFDGKAEYIKQVIITGDIENIGSYVFSACTSLVSISIPTSVNKIEDNAFLYCHELENIYYEGTKLQWENIETSSAGNEYLLDAKVNYKEETHICTFSEWKVVNKPTCIADGNKIRECSCGKEEVQIIPATGKHNFGEWETITQETEYHNGEEKRNCKNCSYVETRIVDNIKILIGDVNSDSKITASDARVILQLVAGLRSIDTVELKIADVNADDKITAVDARYILQMVAGLK